MTIKQQLDDARAEVARLERAADAASCAEAGHDMKFAGGANAGCSDFCACSVPVHICKRCGDSDYGDNAEAKEIIRACAERREN